MAYKRGPNVYTIEASVPLADLALDPKETGVLQGDVGVIFADATGANRDQRLYYYNHHTSITADLTTEATLQPGEWGVVERPLGPNLLKNGGFEEPLATDRNAGWKVSEQKNGGVAGISHESPHFCACMPLRYSRRRP